MVLLRAFRRLALEDSGQDLIEYALLSGFIGLAGVAAWAAVGAVMQTAYDSWVNAAVADADMPEPPSP